MDKMGLVIIAVSFRMTPAYLNAITTAKEELNAKRQGDPNGPWGEYNPRPENGAKYSPRRFRLDGPEGPFRCFQPIKVIFRFFGHLWRPKCHSKVSRQNTSPLNILVLPENTFMSSKNQKIV